MVKARDVTEQAELLVGMQAAANAWNWAAVKEALTIMGGALEWKAALPEGMNGGEALWATVLILTAAGNGLLATRKPYDSDVILLTLWPK